MSRRRPYLVRCVACLLTVAATVLVVAEGAVAQPTLVTGSFHFAGERSELALAGSATFVGVEVGSRSGAVRSFEPGHASKVVASVTVHPADSEFWNGMFFAASPSRITILDDGVQCAYKGSECGRFERLDAGVPDAPLSALAAGCLLTPSLDETANPELGIPAHTAIAVNGEVVAYDSFGCVIVHDFASGLQRTIPLEATLDPVDRGVLQLSTRATTLRVAGRLVAYRANPLDGEGAGSVVVDNIDTDQALYRVPLPPDDSSGDSPTFDLQSDGRWSLQTPRRARRPSARSPLRRRTHWEFLRALCGAYVTVVRCS